MHNKLTLSQPEGYLPGRGHRRALRGPQGSRRHLIGRALLGLVPAILAFTGMFMCCHRLLVRKGAPLPR